MKKVMFVIPPTLSLGDVGNKMTAQNATIPYGVLSIATYVNAHSKKVGHIFRVLDLNIEPFVFLNSTELIETYKKEINAFHPEIIGISALYNHVYEYIPLLSQKAKEAQPESVIVSGGSCAMSFAEQLLEDVIELDAICYSEGEIPFLDILDAEDAKSKIEIHPSFITKNGLYSKKEIKATLVEHLDDIPPIDFDLIDTNKYKTRIVSYRPVKIENEVMFPMVTTRGCPYNCVFCISGNLHGKKLRSLSPERVFNDAKILIEKYGVNSISIEDDQFLLDKQRAKDMLRMLIPLNLNLYASCGFTVSLFDAETCYLLKQAGFTMIHLAIESGSSRVLKEIIEKPINLNHVKPVVKSLRENGLFVHAFLIVGFPGEKEEDRRQTVEFINDVGIDWSSITLATPIKGSRLYDICVENRYFDKSKNSKNAFYSSILNTGEFTSEEITKKAYEMNLELNFVNNYRFKTGDYQNAANYMSNVATKFPSHAFAHYYLSKCYMHLGNTAKAEEHMLKYLNIVENDITWKEYAEKLHLLQE